VHSLALCSKKAKASTLVRSYPTDTGSTFLVYTQYPLFSGGGRTPSRDCSQLQAFMTTVEKYVSLAPFRLHAFYPRHDLEPEADRNEGMGYTCSASHRFYPVTVTYLIHTLLRKQKGLQFYSAMFISCHRAAY